jgi:tRNA(fMet)-specific endonuclease VapC
VVAVALDTNTISGWMQGPGRVAERLRERSPRDVPIPAVVVHEFNDGLRRAGRRERLVAFAAMVHNVQVLHFDVEAADHAARTRAELESRGMPIGPTDLLVAATARRHRHTLVTHNVAEFARVPELLIDDWY